MTWFVTWRTWRMEPGAGWMRQELDVKSPGLTHSAREDGLPRSLSRLRTSPEHLGTHGAPSECCRSCRRVPSTSPESSGSPGLTLRHPSSSQPLKPSAQGPGARTLSEYLPNVAEAGAEPHPRSPKLRHFVLGAGRDPKKESGHTKCLRPLERN